MRSPGLWAAAGAASVMETSVAVSAASDLRVERRLTSCSSARVGARLPQPLSEVNPRGQRSLGTGALAQRRELLPRAGVEDVVGGQPRAARRDDAPACRAERVHAVGVGVDDDARPGA